MHGMKGRVDVFKWLEGDSAHVKELSLKKLTWIAISLAENILLLKVSCAVI